eukprot:5119126-Amphidinium_carterae.1
MVWQYSWFEESSAPHRYARAERTPGLPTPNGIASCPYLVATDINGMYYVLGRQQLLLTQRNRF